MRRRNLESALEEAAKAPAQGAPPDWVRLVTAVGDSAAAASVAQAVAGVSEGLQTSTVQLRSAHRHLGEAGPGATGAAEVEEWSVSVSVPPKATLLVSSMVGEALYEVHPGQDPPPMLLAENLEDESNLAEAAYVCGAFGKEAFQPGSMQTDSVSPADALFDLVRGAVEGRLAARAQVDEAAAQATLQTTGARRPDLEAWLRGRGVDVAEVTWTPVGGSAEYLQWVAAVLAGGDAPGEGETGG